MIWNIDDSELENTTYEKHMKSNSHAHFIGDRMNLFELKRDFVLRTSLVKRKFIGIKLWIKCGLRRNNQEWSMIASFWNLISVYIEYDENVKEIILVFHQFFFVY